MLALFCVGGYGEVTGLLFCRSPAARRVGLDGQSVGAGSAVRRAKAATKRIHPERDLVRPLG